MAQLFVLSYRHETRHTFRAHKDNTYLDVGPSQISLKRSLCNIFTAKVILKLHHAGIEAAS